MHFTQFENPPPPVHYYLLDYDLGHSSLREATRPNVLVFEHLCTGEQPQGPRPKPQAPCMETPVAE